MVKRSRLSTGDNKKKMRLLRRPITDEAMLSYWKRRLAELKNAVPMTVDERNAEIKRLNDLADEYMDESSSINETEKKILIRT